MWSLVPELRRRVNVTQGVTEAGHSSGGASKDIHTLLGSPGKPSQACDPGGLRVKEKGQ